LFSVESSLSTGAERLPPRCAIGLLGLLSVLGGCGSGPAAESGREESPATPPSIEVVDDAARPVRLERPASRVLSLLPSTTELLLAFGAADRLVARTDFDEDPTLADLPSVGGGLTPSLEQIAALQPDLVVAWEEAGGARIRTRLEALGIAVFAARTRDTADIFRNLEHLGRLVGLEERADALAAHLRSELDAVARSTAGSHRPRSVYLISLDPPIIAGRGLFIGELLEVAGGENVFSEPGAASPQVSLEEILRRRPEVVLVASDAAGARADVAGRPGWRELAAGGARFHLVPADSVHRPGPRIARAAWLLSRILHGDREAAR
jgi:ABC-type Fe3+-hydroxamate transport system substrate-binding protein